MKKLTFAILVLFLVSCNENRVVNNYEGIAELNWERDNALSYTFDSPGEDIPYTVQIGLRHYTGIQYGDISVNLNMVTPSGESTDKEYIISLRDQNGDVKGSAMGDVTDIEVPVEEGMKFDEQGTYKFKISHTMEPEIVSGVMEVGLVIDKAAAGN
ncbi:gliding motility lipoprotein GldH [Flexithrix dorotheae]|uniref:gliding motility lipoprotein GldH n=1 Tax=Flexithrix dorotheae TaxID=70993 RepID=UPI00037B1B73|nr:gliding motility lipoprotein GldH [Flexithrix dorotheae]